VGWNGRVKSETGCVASLLIGELINKEDKMITHLPTFGQINIKINGEVKHFINKRSVDNIMVV